MKTFLACLLSLTTMFTMACANKFVSTMQPFSPGDIFVGATVLNNPDDDHAGRGRIVHFDKDLNQKGVLWTENTTHLITGLSFAPDGTLWAFDPWKRTTIKIDSTGQPVTPPAFDERPYSKAHFIDNKILLTEQLVGTKQPTGLTTRFRPLPGETEKIGDGDLYFYNSEGTLLQTLNPETHGGMSGGMAITHSVLSNDQQAIFYVSETGPRLMAYDLVNNKQLPDLKTYPENTGNMFFDLDAKPDGTLIVSMGNRLESFNAAGLALATYPLDGFGWSVVAASHDNKHVFVANWFSGEIIKFDTQTKVIKARAELGAKSIAGLAEYWPG